MVWIVALVGALLLAAAVGFAVGRFWIAALPSLIIVVWLFANPRNPDNDVPSLAGLLLWSVLAGVLVGVVVRKIWHLRPRRT